MYDNPFNAIRRWKERRRIRNEFSKIAKYIDQNQKVFDDETKSFAERQFAGQMILELTVLRNHLLVDDLAKSLI